MSWADLFLFFTGKEWTDMVESWEPQIKIKILSLQKYWWNSCTKPANGNMSRSSGQLVSLLCVPFNLIICFFVTATVLVVKVICFLVTATVIVVKVICFLVTAKSQRREIFVIKVWNCTVWQLGRGWLHTRGQWTDASQSVWLGQQWHGGWFLFHCHQTQKGETLWSWFMRRDFFTNVVWFCSQKGCIYIYYTAHIISVCQCLVAFIVHCLFGLVTWVCSGSDHILHDLKC